MNPLKKKNSDYQIEEIKIELSYKCIMNCVHCSSDGAKDKEQSISYEKACEIIDSASSLGVKTISLSGGEPFLWPRLEKLINLIKTKGLNTKVYTCGVSKNFERIVKKIAPNNLSIIFSLYSSKAIFHEEITGIEGSFERTVSSIKVSLQNQFTTEIHYVPLKSNYRELEKLAEFCGSLGVEKISILRFVPQGRGVLNNHLVLNKKENLELKNQIVNLRKRGFNIRTGSPLNYLLLEGQPSCTSGSNKLIISPDLSIYPCDAFKQIRSDSFFGCDEYSSLEKHGLLECWNNSIYLNSVRAILKSNFEEPCKSCDMVNSCQSGCLAQKIIQTNSFQNSPDPSCILSKKTPKRRADDKDKIR